MRLVSKRIGYHGLRDRFALWFITDLHIGHAAHRADILARDIKAIQDDPNALWIGGGDYIEAIGPKDRRWNSGSMASWIEDPETAIQEQAERAVEVLSPIAEKCLALLRGNHELASRKHSNYDPYREIVRGLALARGEKLQKTELALGVHGFVVLRFANGQARGRKWSLPIYVHHGHGGGRLRGGHALTLARTMDDNPGALLVMMGHRHVQQYVSKVGNYVTVKDQLVTVQRKAFFVGCYLDGTVPRSKDDKVMPREVYSEMAALPQPDLGSFPIFITPGHKQFKALI